ncbi:hypothetical protein HIV01_003435 [Lysobacter arenosi]|uniref:Uncharacterized protein n=1 Tax=Lysobacter arenosi TaxID=2795387 RepID=A0ABX7RF91_9GAMM|nr:hypothetical protein [Lysobacter arenosi]QSX75597.1 hypothetical protein HIV01_003435 [Lysobacter arenosi]
MTTADTLMPLQAEPPSNKQRLFVRYYSAILIDLVVLNLFDEFSDKVHIESFTVSLMAALLLQILLKLTIALEHYVAAFFKARPGGFMTFMRWFSAWLILFGSKFVILEAISFAFGTDVRFDGRWHGLLVLITVIVVMLIAEEVVVRIYRRLT